MELYGKFLEAPKLRFNYSSASAIDSLPKRGLYKYGPYDSALLGKEEIKCIVLFPAEKTVEKQIFIEGLTKGEGTFRGFQHLFRLSLRFIAEIPFKSQEEFDRVLDQIHSENPDIVYIILNDRDSNIYNQAKLKLLANGIPSQMIKSEKISEASDRQYILENISLATYAKIGGTPWTISTMNNDNNLILGVSRAMDHQGKYLVGFVVLFTNDGDYLFMNSSTPVIDWNQYVEGLSKSVEKAIYEYKSNIGVPTSIIVHFHKRPEKKEIEAIENALRNTIQDIPYALVHINEYSNFKLFDSSHPSYIPPKGLCVNLTLHEALLLLDGRLEDKRYKAGVPTVLNVRIDKRSTLTPDYFPYIFKQIYDFSFVNWRGFNAAAIPITLNYSKLIARMVINIGISNWNQIIASGRLRDKGWFL